MWLLPRPRVVLVDVGFTLAFLDGERMAALAAGAGVSVDAALLNTVDPRVCRKLMKWRWPHHRGSPAPADGGIRYFRGFLDQAMAAGSRTKLDDAAMAIWLGHLDRNMWCRLVPGTKDALECLKVNGFKLGVVSNSEGTIERLMIDLGLRSFFDIVVDSWAVGVSKPDSRIFNIALERLGVVPEHAVYVGDSLMIDVMGAQSAGIQPVLVDPFGVHRDVDVPRFLDFPAFAEAICPSRCGPGCVSGCTEVAESAGKT